MHAAAADLEFETAARLRDEIKRLQATELAVADDPLARQDAIDDRTGGYRGPRKYGNAANLPETRARKPTLDEMGPHNLGGGTGRPLGATEAARSKAGRPGTR